MNSSRVNLFDRKKKEISLKKEIQNRILGETWSSSSDARKINFFLFGVKSVNYGINCALFREVQTTTTLNLLLYSLYTFRYGKKTKLMYNY